MSDVLRRPLKRRTAAERLKRLKPTGLQTASAAAGLSFVLMGCWLVFAPWPEPRSPLVRMQIDASDPVVTASRPPVDATEDPPPAAPEAFDEGPLPPGAIDADALPTSSEAAAEAPTKIAADRISMVAAPVKGVSEQGPYGSLPRLGKDGRKPWQVYARPVHKQLMRSNAPKVAILLGGMGLNPQLTERAIAELPGEVSVAFAPYPDGLQRLVNLARAGGHEAFLQLPMEPVGYPDVNPGPRTLLSSMSPQESLDSLAWFMGRFAGYVGVMNYMGAKLAGRPEALAPIMGELGKRGLIFLDDGSFARSQAIVAGTRAGVTVRQAELVIDADPSEDAIAAALKQLETAAARSGLAIGVGTGLPATIGAVAQWAREAKQRGIELVPVSAAFRDRTGG